MTADTRRETFENGKGFLDHIGTVDDLYIAVMTDITKKSFASAKPPWIVSTKKFDTSNILAPKTGNDGRPPLIMSGFDKPGIEYQRTNNISIGAAVADLVVTPISDFHRAWAGDEMAYIDRLASTLFMSLNKEE
jgi:hypothetical protein